MSLHVGDCVELMRSLPTGCIDLAITSPPYDHLRSYNGYRFDFDAIANELYRVIKPCGVVVWVVGDACVDGSETGTSFRQALKFMDIGFKMHDTMIYHRLGPPRPQPRYEQHFEYMFVLSKGKPATINLLREPCRFAGQTRRASPYSRAIDGSDTNIKPRHVHDTKVRGNVWKYYVGGPRSQTDRIAFQHPATFPEKLAEDHILSWSNPGELVFDPMCGSGTTLKMAKLNDRRWLGYDISSDYIALANERLQKIKTSK